MSEVEPSRPPLSIFQGPEEGHEEVDENGARSDRRLMIKTGDPDEIIESRSGFEIMEHNLQSPAGHQSGSYPCVYDNTNGHLLVGLQGVEFVGVMFFFEKSVEIKWTNVLEVVPGTVGGGSCISFLMRTGGQDYDFYNIANPERVWARLVSLHNDFLRDAQAPLMTPLRASIRRMSSAPNINMAKIENGPTGTEAAYVAAATLANTQDPGYKYPTAASSVAQRQSLMRSRQKSHTEDGVEIMADLEEAWKELQQGGGEASYATSAIQVSTIHCIAQKSCFYTLLKCIYPHRKRYYSRILFSDAIYKLSLTTLLQIQPRTH
jgi:hypothetical protein